MPTTPSDFEKATKRELTYLAAQAARVRPAHNCPEGRDKAPCRICAHYRTLHARIDDHLAQLFDEDWAPIAALDFATPMVTR